MNALSKTIEGLDTPKSLQQAFSDGSFEYFPERIVFECPCCLFEPKVAWLRRALNPRESDGFTIAIYVCGDCGDSKMLFGYVNGENNGNKKH